MARGAPKVGQYLAEVMRARILGDELPPGTPLLSEADMVVEHGVARASVREALRLLESEGLITVRPGPGGGIRSAHPGLTDNRLALAIYLTVTRTTGDEFAQFRAIIEPEVARLAARDASDEQRAGLVNAALQPSEVLGGNSADFHEMLAAATNNRVIGAVYASISPIVELNTAPNVAKGGDISANDAAHRRIARAVAAGDGELAAEAMSRHLSALRDFMRRHGFDEMPILPASQWRLPGSNGRPVRRAVSRPHAGEIDRTD